MVSVRAQRTTATLVAPKPAPLATGGSSMQPKKECSFCAVKAVHQHHTCGNEVSPIYPFFLDVN